MFWGLEVKPNKKYSQTVAKSIHISQAVLDTSNSSQEDILVRVTSEEKTYILCCLKRNQPNCALDLNFAEGESISLFTTGNGTVYLTGYLISNDKDLFDSNDEDMSEEEAADDTIVKNLNKLSEKGKIKETDSEESESDDNEFQLDENDDNLMSSNDSEDVEYEDSNEDSDEEKNSPPAKKKKIENYKKEQKKQNGNLDNGKKENLKKQKTEIQQKSQKKTLSGGVMIEDLLVGRGLEAKVGKKVHVYYEGRLKSNNKVFDSSDSGPPFKFSLGRGEVIKGWDIGLVGMKVGGKRRITCPPNMAYGAKGSPPVIPGNSTLVFDVELKNVLN